MEGRDIQFEEMSVLVSNYVNETAGQDSRKHVGQAVNAADEEDFRRN